MPSLDFQTIRESQKKPPPFGNETKGDAAQQKMGARPCPPAPPGHPTPHTRLSLLRHAPPSSREPDRARRGPQGPPNPDARALTEQKAFKIA